MITITAPWTNVPQTEKRDLLFLSNGHGEDAIGCNVLDCVLADTARPLAIDAWPMVGAGTLYRNRVIPICRRCEQVAQRRLRDAELATSRQ
jgi:hypothetical protein